MKFFQCLVLFVISFGTAQASVTDYLSTIKNSPPELYSFFKNMPKGGELHYHLAGGAYPEHMLAIAARYSYCLDTDTYNINNYSGHCQGVKANEMIANPEEYANTVRAWSMKDFIAGKETNHDHFFTTFYQFMPIITQHSPPLLAEIIRRAANQNEKYMEIMILLDNGESTNYSSMTTEPLDFQSFKNKLMADPDYKASIQHDVAQMANIVAQTHKELGCDQKPELPACKVVVKYQYYVLREQSLPGFFAQALHAFATVNESSDFVGVNIVQAEDGLLALKNYKAQLKIFEWLHQQYPKVRISLHAGELNSTLVPPEDLRTHIHDALNIGQAQRIGHGVAISYEDDAINTLKDMAKRLIPVEINLISNKIILGISGKEHPINTYLKYNVPVVLSTDDEGVLRTDLTQQFVTAVSEQNLDYPTIKQVNRNVLTYSFLPGKSIWANAAQAKMVDECQETESQSCQEFLKSSQKATLQWQLEKELKAFEAEY